MAGGPIHLPHMATTFLIWQAVRSHLGVPPSAHPAHDPSALLRGHPAPHGLVAPPADCSSAHTGVFPSESTLGAIPPIGPGLGAGLPPTGSLPASWGPTLGPGLSSGGLGLGLSGGQITDEAGHAFSLDDFYGEALGAIEDSPDAHFALDARLHGLAPNMPFDDSNAAAPTQPP